MVTTLHSVEQRFLEARTSHTMRLGHTIRKWAREVFTSVAPATYDLPKAA